MCAQFVPTKIKVGATPDVRFQYGLIMRPRAQQAGIDSHQVEREYKRQVKNKHTKMQICLIYSRVSLLYRDEYPNELMK